MDGRIEVVKYNFDTDIEIVNLGDLHLANRMCDRTMVKRAVQYIAEKDNRYWLSTGDLMEVAIPGFPGSYEAKMLPKDELEELGQIIHPIASKCLGLVESNHHARAYKAAGLSLDEIICDKLGLPFLGAIGVVCIVCGRAAYHIVLHHGFGGGRKDGSKINNMEELAWIIPGADVYLFGHTHTSSYVPGSFFPIDKKRNICSEMICHFVTTGHYINYPKSYAEKKLLRPKPKGSALLYLKHCLVGKLVNKQVNIGFFRG